MPGARRSGCFRAPHHNKITRWRFTPAFVRQSASAGANALSRRHSRCSQQTSRWRADSRAVCLSRVASSSRLRTCSTCDTAALSSAMVLVEECAPASGPSTDATSPQEHGDADCECGLDEALGDDAAHARGARSSAALSVTKSMSNGVTQVSYFAGLDCVVRHAS